MLKSNQITKMLIAASRFVIDPLVDPNALVDLRFHGQWDVPGASGTPIICTFGANLGTDICATLAGGNQVGVVSTTLEQHIDGQLIGSAPVDVNFTVYKHTNGLIEGHLSLQTATSRAIYALADFDGIPAETEVRDLYTVVDPVSLGISVTASVAGEVVPSATAGELTVLCLSESAAEATVSALKAQIASMPAGDNNFRDAFGFLSGVVVYNP